MADLSCDVAIIGAGTAGLAAERDLANLREHVGRSHCGMTGECHLTARREDAHAPGVPRIGRRKDERRLGVVELARDRLHLSVREATRVGKHSERISSVEGIRENVGGVKGVRHSAVDNADARSLRLLPL